jgi:cytoskeleton protein RodZ
VNEPESMGAALRSARTEKRISIERAAEELKIRHEFLMRMESEEFDFLAPAYARGFLRSYVRYLGLDEAPFLEQFDHIYGGGVIDASQIAAVDQDKPTKPMRDRRSISLMTIVIAAGAGILLLLGLVGLFAPERSRDNRNAAVADREETSPTPTLEKVKDRKKKEGGGGGPNPTPSPTSTLLDEGIQLAVEADDGPCWVEVEADGETIFAETLDVGEEEEFDADEEMVVVLGAPSSVALMLNDLPVDSLDTEGPGAVKLFLPEDLYRLGVREEPEILDTPAVSPTPTISPTTDG